MLASPLCKFCAQTSREAIQLVVDCLSCMMSGSQPHLKDLQTPFLHKVVARIGYFIRVTIEGKVEVGAIAVQHTLRQLEEKGCTKCSIADIEPIVVFKWLLPKEDQVKATTLQCDVLKNARASSSGNVGGGAASSSASGDVAAGERKSGGKANKSSEVEAALAMFG